MSRSKSGGGSSGKIGRSLVKDRNKSNKRISSAGRDGKGWLHSCDLDDGYEWGRLNLNSVTEQSRLDEFLSTAELAGVEFKAQKLNVKVVESGTYTGLPTPQESAMARQAEEENRQYLSIPRRPQWDSGMSAGELAEKERESFLEWRRSLIRLQEDERLTLTPFERNLEFWRQLWRVVERSDVLVQIVDARNPLLFRCEDLEKYALEIGPKKVNLLLISKADLLTPKQRRVWMEYFRENSTIVVAFWSAQLEIEEAEREASEAAEREAAERKAAEEMGPEVKIDAMEEEEEGDEEEGEEGDEEGEEGEEEEEEEEEEEGASKLLTREELLDLFHAVSSVPPGSLTTVGMVGYPNVGKSSTINALFQGKKVPVSATPGRTKHFQTLFLSESLMLCDCPGLVFPSFLSSKADMVCSGILPIDQLRAHLPPVSLLCQQIPRHVLERTYGIEIARPGEGEEPNRQPHAHELLAAYGCMRGYMTSHGQPDEPRSARYILKDYVNGKLSYCHAPPGVDGREFNMQLLPGFVGGGALAISRGEGQSADISNEEVDHTGNHCLGEFDTRYFQQERNQAVIKSVGPHIGVASTGDLSGKPWKRHRNGHKREKIRRTQ